MSGHSKWSTIKHQKSAEDKKRGKLFSRLVKAIMIAAREGGGDPQANAKLRMAIDQAKQANMPKENIKRAVERGEGKDGSSQLERVVYEGYGPAKIAVMAECITDNKNRTAAEVKSFFERNDGGLGSPGSVAYLFERKGIISLEKEKDVQDQLLKLIDLGIEDFEEDQELIEIYTQPSQLAEKKKLISQAGFLIRQAEISLEPAVSVTISEPEKKEQILKFLSGLDDLDDVQKIYCNVDLIND